jgi:RNA polymerase sigma-70 factor (ECF subfamily)
VSTAQDLPVPYGEPATAPALRLLPAQPLDFDEAVLHLRPRLHRYAVRRLGDSHEAEELVQEALLRAYTHREQLSTADDLAAWATVVTGRLVIDRLRVRGRFTPVADLPEGTRVGRDTADVVVARDEARLALDALDAMPTRQAALLWAREVEGQSYDELCTRFRMTEPAVRSVLTRARKALRKEYSSRGGTLPVGGLAVLAPWVVGLSWADRLRQVANRMTAPAALGAAGVTVLGGLVLSPFGAVPHLPATTPFSPTQAVVIEDEVLHGFVVAPAATSAASRAARQGTRTAPPPNDTLAQVATDHLPCTNSPDANDDLSVIPLPVGIPGDPSAGPPKCDEFETNPGYTIYLDHPLPQNPTGIRYLALSSTDIDCTSLPQTGLVKCEPTQPQGATQ